MSAADWYPDPTRPGRLRYWDGAGWTMHVSERGEVETDPIEGIAPAPPRPETGAGAASAGSAADANEADATLPQAGAPQSMGGLLSTGTPGGPTMAGRIGFGIAAVGGVVSALSSGRVAVEQTEPFPATISVGGGAWIGIVAAVICIGGALAPSIWGRIAGVIVGWLAGLFIAFAVIGFRTNDNFASGADVTLGPAGIMMTIGALLLLAGSALALWGLRVPITQSDPATVANPREGKAVSSLVSGIVGLLILIPAPAAVALGLMARDDDRASGGKSGGAGMAVAGIVLGIVGMAAWGIGLSLFMFFASP